MELESEVKKKKELLVGRKRESKEKEDEINQILAEK